MALNDDWLADVRRWYFDERPLTDGTPAQGRASDPPHDAGDPIGYEAAWIGALDASAGAEDSGRPGSDLR